MFLENAGGIGTRVCKNLFNHFKQLGSQKKGNDLQPTIRAVSSGRRHITQLQSKRTFTQDLIESKCSSADKTNQIKKKNKYYRSQSALIDGEATVKS